MCSQWLTGMVRQKRGADFLFSRKKSAQTPESQEKQAFMAKTASGASPAQHRRGKKGPGCRGLW